MRHGALAKIDTAVGCFTGPLAKGDVNTAFAQQPRARATMMLAALLLTTVWAGASANVANHLRSQQHEALKAFVDQERCAGDACTVKLFFVHLHKCGGTTVEAHLRAMYGAAYLVPDSGHEVELRDALVAQNATRIAELRAWASDFRVFARHVAYGVHATLGVQRPLYLTLLREPAARLLSVYGYLTSPAGAAYLRRCRR